MQLSIHLTELMELKDGNGELFSFRTNPAMLNRHRLFIVEGVSTIGCAFMAPFFLLDYPATTKRLSPEQRALAVARLQADGITSRSSDGEVASVSHWRAFVNAISNWRVWWLCVGYMTIIGCYSLSYFNPTLVQGLGYKGSEAQ